MRSLSSEILGNIFLWTAVPGNVTLRYDCEHWLLATEQSEPEIPPLSSVLLTSRLHVDIYPAQINSTI